jgi:hypothetical protein
MEYDTVKRVIWLDDYGVWHSKESDMIGDYGVWHSKDSDMNGRLWSMTQ